MLINIRNFHLLWAIAGLTGLGLTACIYSGKDVNDPSPPPNIVVIMADDMGYSDIGCFGSEIATPNLDRLAAEGIRLTQFHNTSRCCPSRASLMTGLYSHQAGVGHMMADDSLPGYRGFISNNAVTMAEVLSASGYHSIISGKWHAGYPEHAWPMKRGFDRHYGSNGTTGHYFGVAEGRLYIIDDTIQEVPGPWVECGTIRYKPLYNEDGSRWYATDAYTDRAMRYIRELRESEPDRPFFLYLPYTAPHWPLHAFEEDIAKYEGTYMKGWDTLRARRYHKMIDQGIISPDWQLSERNELAEDWSMLSDEEKGNYDRLMAVYAAMIDRMDQNIGRLIDFLEATGDLDRTIIMFFSDNGGCHEPVDRDAPGVLAGTPDSYVGYKHSWANASNTPLRWFKKYAHEGGSSSPFVAWYPDLIPAGVIDHQVAHIIDIMPTVCELAGADYPEAYKGNEIIPVEGISLVPVLKGETRQGHDRLFWEHEGNRAVREGKWKLVSRFDKREQVHLPWELYNIDSDRSETNDLSGSEPELVKRLEAAYFEWADRCNVMEYNELTSVRNQRK